MSGTIHKMPPMRETHVYNGVRFNLQHMPDIKSWHFVMDFTRMRGGEEINLSYEGDAPTREQAIDAAHQMIGDLQNGYANKPRNNQPDGSR